MRRLMGLWGLVFAVILAGIIGLLGYLRETPSEDWMVFTVQDANYQNDVYRFAPSQGKFINITRTPQLNETLLTHDNATLLMITTDPAYYQEAHELDLNGRTKLIKAMDVDYFSDYEGWSSQFDIYEGWSSQGELLFSVTEDDMGIAIRSRQTDGTFQTLTPVIEICTPENPHVPSQYYAPMWSPDGEWIYYGVVFCDSGIYETYRMRRDGSEPQPVFLQFNPPIWWTSDGEWIIISGFHQGRTMLYRMRPDGSEVARLTEDSYEMVGVTPHWIYVRTVNSLHRLKIDGSALEVVEDSLAYPIILQGEWVYFGTQDHRFYRIHDHLPPEELTTPNIPDAGLLMVSPDQQWLYFIARTSYYEATVYQVARDKSSVTTLPMKLDPRHAIFWLPHPDLPWHTTYLALGAVGLCIVGFILRRRAA